MKRHSFVYAQFNDQIILFQTIQFKYQTILFDP